MGVCFSTVEPEDLSEWLKYVVFEWSSELKTLIFRWFLEGDEVIHQEVNVQLRLWSVYDVYAV